MPNGSQCRIAEVPSKTEEGEKRLSLHLNLKLATPQAVHFSNLAARLLKHFSGDIHNMSNLRPLGDKVVVQVIESEDKTSSGIYLPDSAKKKPQTGKIIAVGNGRVLDSGERNALTVKKGDTVLFSKYGGNEVTIDGEEYTILDEDQIYAVLN